MSIYNSTPVVTGTPAVSGHEPRIKNAAQGELSGMAEEKSKTRVSLSIPAKNTLSDDSQDIDYDKVAYLRNALAAGELEISAEKISRALVQEIFNF